jgi:hypothetical protein
MTINVVATIRLSDDTELHNTYNVDLHGETMPDLSYLVEAIYALHTNCSGLVLTITKA